MMLESGRVNISLWVGPLLLATILTSESLPDLGLVDLAKGRRLKKDISDKSLWKRGTYRFQGDPTVSPDRVNPILGFLPEDIRWLQGTLEDDFFWATPVRDGRGSWAGSKNFTFPPRRPGPGTGPGFNAFPDFKYWIQILFKNVPEEISQNLIHDLSSRLERAHEFAFKRRRDAYPDLVSSAVTFENGTEGVPATTEADVPRVRRMTRSVPAVDVTMLKIAKEAQNEVEAVYCLRRDGKPVLSKSAVLELNDLTETEMDVIFSPYSVARLTHERRRAVVAPAAEVEVGSNSLVLPIVIVVTVALVVLVVALFVYRYKKRTQDIEERHWREQETPTSDVGRLQAGLKARSSRRVESEDVPAPAPGRPSAAAAARHVRVYDEQVARVDLGFEPGESDDSRREEAQLSPEASQDSEEALMPSSGASEVPPAKRPRVPPRSKRVGATGTRKVARFEEPLDDASAADSDSGHAAAATAVSVDGPEASKPRRARPKSGYRGAIISDDVPSSSTTAVKPPGGTTEYRDRGLQIGPEARDVGVDSGCDLVAEPDGEEGLLRMKRRFHEILDDAFKVFSPSDMDFERKGRVAVAQIEFEQESDDVPPPLPEKRARSAADSRANFDRPEKARPISALLRSGADQTGAAGVDKNVVTLAVPPKPAWGAHQSDPRFDVDVQASGSQFVKGRSNAPPPSPEPVVVLGEGLRNYEPIDPESGLRLSDPAVPVIKAIKEELKRFGGPTVSPTSAARPGKPKSHGRRVYHV